VILFLLDANVLIDAHRDYYPMSRVPEFWDWLAFQAKNGRVKMPIEIFEEIVAGSGALVDWLKTEEIRTALLLDEDSEPDRVRAVLATGYSPKLTDDEIQTIGKDPFLVAHAAKDKEWRTVVTAEVSKPSRKGANRHVPDACADNGVNYCTIFEMLRKLDFSTGWREK
jgi:Domain of unknown function (DUF4411)